MVMLPTHHDIAVPHILQTCTCLAISVIGLLCSCQLVLSNSISTAAAASQYNSHQYFDRSSIISFPVYHRSSNSPIHDHILPLADFHGNHVHRELQRTRRILDDIATAAVDPLSPSPAISAPSTTPPPTSSGNVPTLRSKLVTLSEPFGQYFAELQIGTPAKPIAVIIDTGSQLMWIQCKPCIECGPQVSAYPIFDPAGSSSYSSVPCDADECSIVDGSIAMDCTTSGACAYKVTYGDNSNSSGIISAETLTFTTSNATGPSPFQLLKFVFGCGVDNEGVETHFNSSGLLGLDRGPYSVVSQLNVDVFSYCLPNREDDLDVSGYLTFGKSNTSASSSASTVPSLQYTPMLQNSYSSFLSQFYYLGLTGVSVNGKLLDIPAVTLELNTQTGTGGTVIDSGTTLTTFVDEAYSVIIQAFDSYVDTSLKRVQLKEDSTTLCYEVPLIKQKEAPEAPTVTLHFAGSTVMELSTQHLFHLYGSDTTNNYYCLTMANSGSLASGAKNFIGNFQQQNFLVEYDIGNSRVGFAPTQCSPSKSTSSSSSDATAIGRPLWYLTIVVIGILYNLL